MSPAEPDTLIEASGPLDAMPRTGQTLHARRTSPQRQRTPSPTRHAKASAPATATAAADKPWMHGLAGVTGGSLAMMTFYPLDFLRTRMHTLHQGSCAAPLRSATEIVRQEGLRGMYRGMGVSVVSHSLGWGLYLLSFRSAQRRIEAGLQAQSIEVGPSARDFLSACCAATLTGGVITPLHVLKTRKQLSERNGGGNRVSAREIVRHEGWRALFRGIGPQILLTGNTCIQVTIYEWFRRNLFSNKEDPSSLQVAFASGLSKAVASALFNPLEVVRTRLQDQRNHGNAAYSSMRAGLTTLWRTEGVCGLYRGLPVNVARVIPSTVFAFVLYEKCLAATRASYSALTTGVTVSFGGSAQPQTA